VTAMSHASLLSKRKLKTKQNKINIKSEKLNKRKEKLSVFTVFYNKQYISMEHKPIDSI